MLDACGLKIEGYVKIKDVQTNEILVDKKNAIHYENFSQALAYGAANKSQNFIYTMNFGNGGTSVDSTGLITYLPPNNTALNATLHNQTYSKIVDDTSLLNQDPINNNITIRHTSGTTYTDIYVTCLLNYGEPSNQLPFDNSQGNNNYIFDELGLFSYQSGSQPALLLTHVIFHPFMKALSRLIQVEYTVRVSTLTNLTTVT